jgi:hypothetical protein
MKLKIQSLAYLLFAGLIGFTSCSKDEETPAPTIVINTNSLGADQTGGSTTTGTTVTINLTAEASEGISKLNATKTVGGTENTLTGYPVTSGFTSSTKNTWNATYTVVETSGTVVLKFSVEDKKGKVSSKTFTININDLSSYSAKLLGAQTNSAGSYFSASTGEVLTSAQANANVSAVDISYAALGGSATPTLLSWKWRADASTGLTGAVPAGAKETYFASTSLTATDFTAIASSSDSRFSGATVSTSSPQFVGVEANKVYAFLTAEGKKGLVHIASISAGTAGSVTINVKVVN